MALDVENVCTDEDLEGYVLGADNLQTILPENWLADDGTKKTAKKARQQVLKNVEKALKDRGIDSDDIDPDDLTEVVANGTLALCFLMAATSSESPNLPRYKHFKGEYDRLMENLLVSEDDGSGEPETPQSTLQIDFDRG